MSNTEKNKLVQDCVAKVLAEVYPDVEVPVVDRASVEQVLRTFVDNAGLTGLYEMILQIFDNTLKEAGVVADDYWE